MGEIPDSLINAGIGGILIIVLVGAGYGIRIFLTRLLDQLKMRDEYLQKLVLTTIESKDEQLKAWVAAMTVVSDQLRELGGKESEAIKVLRDVAEKQGRQSEILAVIQSQVMKGGDK